VPSLWFLLFTAGMCGLWLWCFRSAWRLAPYYVFILLFETLYCYASEFVAIRMGKYHYGPFLLRVCLGSDSTSLPWVSHLLPPAILCTVPNLCIPLAVIAMEGAFLFTIVRTTELLSPPPYVQPFLCCLAALNLDMLLDPVVSSSRWCVAPGSSLGGGLGLWTWFTGPQAVGYWFGVPLRNYTAWFCNVFAFTVPVHQGAVYLQRLKAQRLNRGEVQRLSLPIELWIALLAFIGRLLLEFVLIFCVRFVLNLRHTLAWQAGVVLSLVGISLLIVLPWVRRFQRDHPFDRVLVAVPAFVFLYCLAALLWSGRFADRQTLFVVWPLALCIGASFALAPYTCRWFRTG